MVFHAGQLFGCVFKIINADLPQNRNPVIFDFLQINQRFLLFVGVKFIAVEGFKIVAIRQIADLQRQLPVIRQVFMMTKTKTASQVCFRFKVSSAANASQVILSMIIQHIPDKVAVGFIRFIFGFNSSAGAAFAEIIQIQPALSQSGSFVPNSRANAIAFQSTCPFLNHCLT